MIHGYVNGTIIQDNVISAPDGAVGTCYGIMVNPSYSRTEVMSNLTIHNNRIYDVGRSSIYVEAVNGAQITDNIIINTTGSMTYYGIQVRSGTEHTRG